MRTNLMAPFGDLSRTLGKIDEMFGYETNFHALTDVEYTTETAGGLTVHIRVPGYSIDDLSVEFQNGMLSVSGELPEDRRTTRLVPNKVRHDLVIGAGYEVDLCNYDAGILMIRFKQLSRAETRKIPIDKR